MLRAAFNDAAATENDPDPRCLLSDGNNRLTGFEHQSPASNALVVENDFVVRNVGAGGRREAPSIGIHDLEAHDVEWLTIDIRYLMNDRFLRIPIINDCAGGNFRFGRIKA